MKDRYTCGTPCALPRLTSLTYCTVYAVAASAFAAAGSDAAGTIGLRGAPVTHSYPLECAGVP